LSKPNWIFRRSDGKSLTFGDDMFGILKMEGIDDLKPEVFKKKKAIGDGDIITGYRIPSRELSVTAELYDHRLNAQMRKVMDSFFNPKFTFDVYITYTAEQRFARNCSLLRYKCPKGNIYKPLQPQVIMLYPDGYFLSVDEFGQDIASIRGGRGWPYVNLVGKSGPFGVHAFQRNVQIFNDGDAEAYCKAVITFTGEVTNPRIMNGDAYVKVLDVFVEGDRLELDAYAKSATKNGKNISTKVDKGSRWNDMIFVVGDNTIAYDADFGNNLMNVNVYFNKRYLGV